MSRTARAGVGLTVLPALGAAHLTPGLVAVPVVRPAPVRSIHAVLRDAVVGTPPARAVLDTLHEVARARVDLVGSRST